MVSEILNIKVDKIMRMEGDGNIRAYCDLIFGGLFFIKGFKVIEGDNGVFVSWPQRSNAQGKRYNIFVPATREVAEYIKEVILKAYEGGE